MEPMTDEPVRAEAANRQVFVVHGRNLVARDALFAFLRAVDLRPIEWSEAVALTKKTIPYVGEILHAALTHAAAIVVLFTPDDLAQLKIEHLSEGDPDYEREPTGQPRPNVLFEAGMALGRDEKRTILVQIGRIRPFSDIGGRYLLNLTDSTERRQEFALRLRSAGCSVNMDGTDWHNAGRFADALSVRDRDGPARNAVSSRPGDQEELVIETEYSGKSRIFVHVANRGTRVLTLQALQAFAGRDKLIVLAHERKLPLLLSPGETEEFQVAAPSGERTRITAVVISGETSSEETFRREIALPR